MSYEVISGDGSSPVLLHVPHAATAIPPDVRAGLLVDDRELASELAAMTDAGTDVAAAGAATGARVRPWLFVNRLSRLVVDPERFPDEREDMNAVGMGAVYTRTSAGRPLRTGPDPSLITRFFEPYARAIADLVDARLAAAGRVTIVDVHSYPAQRLPYERGGTARPSVCLGTDPDHTPPELQAAARRAFREYDVAVNTPFAGCYVPLRHYRVERRVAAIMVEVRRDAIGTVGPALQELIDTL